MSDQRTEKGVEHTAGPWTQCKDGDCPCGLIFCDGGGVFVAQAFNANNRDKHGLPDPVPTVESGKANARLIAVAPEMLEALEDSDDTLGWAATELARAGFIDLAKRVEAKADHQARVAAKAKGTDHATG